MENVGASLAIAPNVLFMSPDVIPDSPGWLGTLLAFKADTPDAGALAPMLLYEDGSVQHAGIDFDRASAQELRLLDRPEHDLWEPRYVFKGLPQSVAGVAEARSVPAVSNACMLVERELFERVGGFRNLFLGEDFEAADLCLRLSEAGRTNWYVPGAVLHHLEGRSRPDASPYATQHDVIVQSQIWGERIGALASS
jgi:O-antigen biosynthesis protein